MVFSTNGTALLPPRQRERVCFGCGHPPEAAWHGATATVGVCRHCALDTLPGLLANALIANVSLPEHGLLTLLRGILSTARQRFWDAVTERLARSEVLHR
jgi:hypothetical protein